MSDSEESTNILPIDALTKKIENCTNKRKPKAEEKIPKTKKAKKTDVKVSVGEFTPTQDIDGLVDGSGIKNDDAESDDLNEEKVAAMLEKIKKSKFTKQRNLELAREKSLASRRAKYDAKKKSELKDLFKEFLLENNIDPAYWSGNYAAKIAPTTETIPIPSQMIQQQQQQEPWPYARAPTNRFLSNPF